MKPTTDNIFTFLSTNLRNFLCDVFSSRLHKDRNYVENIISLFKIAFGDDKQFIKVDPFRVFADRVCLLKKPRYFDLTSICFIVTIFSIVGIISTGL